MNNQGNRINEPVKVHVLNDDGVTAVPVSYVPDDKNPGAVKAVFDLGTITEGDFTQIDVQCSPEPDGVGP